MKMEQPNLETSPEEVLESCLNFRGEIFTGATHVWALDKLEKKYPEWKDHKGEIEIGFLTNKGRTVGYEEADDLNNEKLKRGLK